MVICGLGESRCILSGCKANSYEDKFDRVTFKVTIAGTSFESDVNKIVFSLKFEKLFLPALRVLI